MDCRTGYVPSFYYGRNLFRLLCSSSYKVKVDTLFYIHCVTGDPHTFAIIRDPMSSAAPDARAWGPAPNYPATFSSAPQLSFMTEQGVAFTPSAIGQPSQESTGQPPAYSEHSAQVCSPSSPSRPFPVEETGGSSDVDPSLLRERLCSRVAGDAG